MSVDIQKIKQRTDLVKVIERDLGSGTQSGVWIKWNCPFHKDQTPSLCAKKGENYWKCFSCEKSGDVIDWMEEFHNMSFGEAIDFLSGDLYMSDPTAGLFGTQNLKNRERGVLCEGEFDAMLLDPECGDMVGVATLGSAGTRLDVDDWWRILVHMKVLFVVYDQYEAGKSGAKKLLQQLKRFFRLNLPKMENGKDITDCYLQGGNLRFWLAMHTVLFEKDPTYYFTSI